MKRIDSHIHFGPFNEMNLDLETIKKYMAEAHIEGGILSGTGCIEYTDRFVGHKTQSQVAVNDQLLQLIKKEDNLKMKFWIKPYFEKITQEVCDFIQDNREHVVALKIHPYHSQLKVTDPKMIPYIDFAKQVDLPVAVHTAQDVMSDVDHLYQLAKMYPTVKFVAVHLGLGTDHQKAIKYVRNQHNLYGDTTWVAYDKLIKVYDKALGEKLLFGTDIPIGKYDFYKQYLEDNNLDERLFNTNITEVFGIKGW